MGMKHSHACVNNMHSLGTSHTPYSLSKFILLPLLCHAPTSYQILHKHQQQHIGLTLFLYGYSASHAKLLSSLAHWSQITRKQGQLSELGEA